VVPVLLGVAMVAEALLFLFLVWTPFGLATNDPALYTFSFQTLLYFAVFSIVSARERRWFWTTFPSRTLCGALALDVVAGTALPFVGLPGLAPLSVAQSLTIFGYALVACLVVNDSLKVAMIHWHGRTG
jgi:hypothetical protein